MSDIVHRPLNAESKLGALHTDFHAAHLKKARGIIIPILQIMALKCTEYK